MNRYAISGVLIADHRDLDSDAARERPLPSLPVPGWTEAAAVMASLFDEFIVVAADPSACLAWDAMIVRDHYRPPGLLSGIHAGLFSASHPHIIVAAAVDPVTSDGVEPLMKALESRWDAVLTESGQTCAALPGIYGKRALRPLTQLLASGEWRFDRFLSRIRTRRVAAQDLNPAGGPNR